jgi:hypothetical protein
MDYIYTSPSLSKQICDEIIRRYDSEVHLKYEGVTASGMDKKIKDTQDMIIPDNEEWDDMNCILSDELQKHMKLYMCQIEKADNYYPEHNYGQDYHHLTEKLIQVNPFMIQRYEKQKGKYVYHHDGSNDPDKSRAVTYLWYLNDVYEGGETEFFGGSFKVKPETGKLLLFPACWCYPHRGNKPISDNKYILTGWLYTENKKKTQMVPKICIPSKTVPCESLLECSTQLEVSTQLAYEETILIFKYFYKCNTELFKAYKQTRDTHDSMFEEFTVNTYSSMTVYWLEEQLQHVHERTVLDTIHEIRPFIISSFQILVDQIKKRYRLNCHFDIKGWYVLYNESETFDLDYDLCIQTDLATGDTFISNKYKETSGYQIVYFIGFTFHYLDQDNETKILTLKEVVEPCLELI